MCNTSPIKPRTPPFILLVYSHYVFWSRWISERRRYRQFCFHCLQLCSSGLSMHRWLFALLLLKIIRERPLSAGCLFLGGVFAQLSIASRSEIVM